MTKPIYSIESEHESHVDLDAVIAMGRDHRPDRQKSWWYALAGDGSSEPFVVSDENADYQAMLTAWTTRKNERGRFEAAKSAMQGIHANPVLIEIAAKHDNQPQFLASLAVEDADALIAALEVKS